MSQGHLAQDHETGFAAGNGLPIARIAAVRFLVALLAGIAMARPAGGQPEVSSREQRAALQLISWNGALVLKLEDRPPWGLRGSFVMLALDPGLTRPFGVPGLDEVMDLATFDRRPIALGVKNRQLALVALEGGSWHSIALPRGVVRGAKKQLLTADEKRVVLYDAQSQTVHWRTRDSWRAQTIPPAVEGIGDLVIVGDRLYLTYHVSGPGGEFGGGLVELDLETGLATTLVRPGRCTAPSTELARGPDGALWALEGWPHVGAPVGRLRVLTRGRWRMIASNDHIWARVTKPPRTSIEHGRAQDACPADQTTANAAKVNWRLPLTSLGGLAFDEQGRPVLLGRQIGLVRLEAGKWKRLTPGWPYAKSEGYEFTFLALVGDTAVMGTDRDGLVLWSLKRRRARLVEVTPAEERVRAFCQVTAAEPDGEKDHLRACETAAADLLTRLTSDQRKGCRATLAEHSVLTRRVGATIEVEFIARKCRGAATTTYTLRAPYGTIERRMPIR
jgi:hypothetical protein